MSYMQVKCHTCQAPTVFDEDPYKNPVATRYWKSTYEKPDDALFVIQRKIPNENRRGKITVQLMNEFILRIYCCAQCGLDDYEGGS